MRFGLSWFVALMVVGFANAEGGVDAQWVWFDEGDPQVSAPAGKTWFRREIKITDPSTCQLRLAVDDSFVLWVNGKKVGEGGSGKSHRFNLNGIVEEGPNVFAIEATNKEGPAGLLVDGVIRSQGGSETPVDTGPDWKGTNRAPTGDAWLKPGFAAEGWKTVKSLGKHDQTRWKEIPFTESYLDRYWLADGFEIERIVEPDLAGSIIAMTWGNRGNLIVSQERGPIIILSDTNKDGKFDKATTYSDRVKNCQGLLVVGTDSYAIGDGPDGASLYRLPDANQDDQADGIETLHKYRGGMGEHGPHTVVLGPDGQLYNCVGNHAGVKAKRQPNSPCEKEVEGYLLTPKFEDGRGHAAGIKAPGGTIWRLSKDAKKWWMETQGFRNEYDIAFNEDGELFTFDSDMEWDIGEPWYRPVRVNHCTSGAEFGWRSGAAKWPPHYFDSLPAAVDIGRGSPTGVIFYEHDQLPEKYKGAFLICDWSMGRVIAVHLDPKGASFDGSKTEAIVTGNPLNASDIEIAPDGSILLATGGRGTEGGVYRVFARGKKIEAPKADSVADLLKVPQFSSAWARELAAQVKAKLGEKWNPELEAVVAKGSPSDKVRALTLLSQLGPAPSLDLLVKAAGDESSKVRAFAALLLGYHTAPASADALKKLLSDSDLRVRRRACEAFVRSEQDAPADQLIELLGSDDRFLRFHARLAIERTPLDGWEEKVLSSKNDRILLHGLLALHRVGNNAISPDEILDRVTALVERGTDEKIEALRLAEISLIAGATSPSGQKLGTLLLSAYPTGNRPVDMESLQIIAKVQTPGAAEKLVAALEKETNQENQVHLALVLKYLDEGWTTDLKTRYIRWYNGSSKLDGGHSFTPYLENIVSGTFSRLTPEERRDLVAKWHEYPYAARLLLRRNNPDQIADFTKVIQNVLSESESGKGGPYGVEIYELSLDALGKSSNPESQAILRKLFDDFPDKRDKIASKLAEKASEENRPYYIRALSIASDNTLPFLLRALNRVPGKAQNPEEIRLVIISALKLGDNAGKPANDLLAKLTEVKPEKDSPTKGIPFYQEWFSKTYPNEPKPELPKLAANESKFSIDQILNYLETNPRGQQANVARGKEIYSKALCIKCHKFGSEGQGIGPDLTTLRKRFQKKEIAEAVLFPSQVVSDQYRSVTVVTNDGLVQTGMLAAQQGQDAVVLWLNNGERLEIPKDNIDEQKPSSVSLMPPGLFKDLTLEDIADLFAYLETSKANAEPAGGSPKVGGGK